MDIIKPLHHDKAAHMMGKVKCWQSIALIIIKNNMKQIIKIIRNNKNNNKQIKNNRKEIMKIIRNNKNKQ